MDRKLIQTMLDVDERHWWYRGRRRVIAAELASLPLPDRAQILDAGCGSGATMVSLARYGTVRGVELDEQAASVASGRAVGEVVVGRLEQLPWPDRSFDLITCLDVIEHTPDDRLTLASLLRVCRPGGFLLVTVPAYQALWSVHDVSNHHFRRYSRRMLRAAAAGAGWEVMRLTSFNSVLLAPAALVRLGRRAFGAENGSSTDLELGPEWLNAVLERPLALEASWLGRGRTLPVGLSLLALLRRPPAT